MKLPHVGRLALSLVAAPLVLAAVPATAHGATTAATHAKVLHVFQQLVGKQVINGRGKVLSGHAKLASGYKVSATYREFTGTHARHGARSTGSGSMTCYFQSRVYALCTASVSVAGSSVLGTRVPVDFSNQPVLIAVNGGTGTYSNVHGVITAASVGNSGNADLTIVVAPKPSTHA